MAVIDIDRHILAELAQNTERIDKCMPMVRRAMALHQKNQALIGHLVNVVRDADTGKGREDGRPTV